MSRSKEPTHREAQQYIDKIKAYLAAKATADEIMRRNLDQLDLKSVDSAIQTYEKAIRIKSDGPVQPARQLENARKTTVFVEPPIKRIASVL